MRENEAEPRARARRNETRAAAPVTGAAMRRPTRRAGPRRPLLAAIAGLAASLPLLAAAGVPTVETPPSPRPVAVDGEPSEWQGAPSVILKGDLPSLAATHDDDNLYLMFRFSDRALARRLLSEGFIIWVNGNGSPNNKDETFGIRYGGSAAVAAAVEGADKKGSHTPREGFAGTPSAAHPGWRRDRFEPGTLTVIRLGVKEAAPQGTGRRPAAASAFQDGVFCYEIRVPLGEVGGKVVARPPTEKRRVAVGIAIGGRTEAERALEAGGMHQGLPPGGPSGMGGRPGGPPPGPPGITPVKVRWLRVVLVPRS